MAFLKLFLAFLSLHDLVSCADYYGRPNNYPAQYEAKPQKIDPSNRFIAQLYKQADSIVPLLNAMQMDLNIPSNANPCMMSVNSKGYVKINCNSPDEDASRPKLPPPPPPALGQYGDNTKQMLGDSRAPPYMIPNSIAYPYSQNKATPMFYPPASDANLYKNRNVGQIPNMMPPRSYPVPKYNYVEPAPRKLTIKNTKP